MERPPAQESGTHHLLIGIKVFLEISRKRFDLIRRNVRDQIRIVGLAPEAVKGTGHRAAYKIGDRQGIEAGPQPFQALLGINDVRPDPIRRP